MTEENKFSLKTSNSNFLTKTENFTINYQNNSAPVKLFQKIVSEDFIEGATGPSTPNVSFTKTVILNSVIQWCWISDNTVATGNSIPGAPLSGLGCLITEDYSTSLRSSVSGIERDPSDTAVVPNDIINQTYTSLGNWLFGTYAGESVFLKSGTNGDSQFYTESVYIDNSGVASKLIFNFKTASTCNSTVHMNGLTFFIFFQ